MRRALLAVALLALAVPAAAHADLPTRVTIGAVFDPITYGENAYINGQLVGTAQGGQLVGLEQAPPPFTEWSAVAQVTADAAGYYSFKLHPNQTMQYRTSSQGVPSDTAVQVNVAPRLKLTAFAAGKTSVRFSGKFAPALPGQSVSIQRRSSTGAWTTVASARMRDGKTFKGRLRAHKPVMLRALFTTDGAHLDGFSNAVRVVPGAARASAAAVRCVAPRITSLAFTPDPPVAGSNAALRVAAELSGGRIYAVDVRWGEDGTRDHITLAPSYRKPRVAFTLRHRYRSPSQYRLTARVYAIRNGCRSTDVRTLAPAVAAPQ